VTSQPPDPPPYDVEKAFQQIDALRRSKANDPLTAICERTAQRVARLAARQLSPSGAQAGGEVLMLVSGALAPLVEHQKMSAAVMVNVIALIGLHLAPMSPAHPPTRSTP
jgi:hypothetical protein